MVTESFNPELTWLAQKTSTKCIFAEIINSQRTFEIGRFSPFALPFLLIKHGRSEAANLILTAMTLVETARRCMFGRGRTRVSLDYAAAAGNSKVAGKFVRHVGRRINQTPLISGQGY
ncbi:unnamed protein product [Lasius platythorax]|uniref:Uncharacterized protein n=1 Tax=Lasius platythorax TaxID=488582 RepID=A0AAV2NSD0_9HYME